MFDLSSTITTQLIPRTRFVTKGWAVDVKNNQTHLFCQVNNPDVIDDVCILARDVICNQDALADFLSAVDLDIYVNGVNAKNLRARHQRGETCYANTIGVVMHLAIKRIQDREGGYPEFEELRETILQRCGGIKNNEVPDVLQELCREYRLEARKVNEEEAQKHEPVVINIYISLFPRCNTI